MNVLPLGKKLTIAIDVDGTVADCSRVDFGKVNKNPAELLKARPIKGALEAVKRLYRQGHKIVFYSSRNHGSRKMTEQWLKIHGFLFHHIEMEKFVAHIYIDDRAIEYKGNWNEVKMKIFDK
mgnify:CR=1 FL=1